MYEPSAPFLMDWTIFRPTSPKPMRWRIGTNFLAISSPASTNSGANGANSSLGLGERLTAMPAGCLRRSISLAARSAIAPRRPSTAVAANSSSVICKRMASCALTLSGKLPRNLPCLLTVIFSRVTCFFFSVGRDLSGACSCAIMSMLCSMRPFNTASCEASLVFAFSYACEPRSPRAVMASKLSFALCRVALSLSMRAK